MKQERMYRWKLSAARVLMLDRSDTIVNEQMITGREAKVEALVRQALYMLLGALLQELLGSAVAPMLCGLLSHVPAD